MANRNDEPIPVSHTVPQARTQTIEVSGSIKGESELTKVPTQTYSFNYVHEQHWKLNQEVGPYTLPANSQGKLV